MLWAHDARARGDIGLVIRGGLEKKAGDGVDRKLIDGDIVD